FNIKNSPVLTTLESPSNSSFQTAINIVLENNKDAELVQLLKDFIAANQKEYKTDTDKTEKNISTENYNSKQNQNTSEIISLQQHSID
ncbi:17178_t:CDS:2, partial [Dentiscutata erythropus]